MVLPVNAGGDDSCVRLGSGAGGNAAQADYQRMVWVMWFRWVIEEYPWWNVYHVMSGESYFHHGEIPWLGLLASLMVSALMMIVAVRIYEWRDF